VNARRRSGAVGTIAIAILLAGGCAAHDELAKPPEPGGAREVSGSASAEPASDSASTGDPSGQALLSRRCKSCHARPDLNKYDHEAWMKALTRMRRRMRLPEAGWDSLAVLVPEGAH
jgi:cytochrome c5